MLSHEQAQAQLQQQRQRISTSERLAQAAKLSDKTREVVYRLLGLDNQGKALDWQQIQNSFTYLLTCVDNLSDAERLTLFTFFFPKFAPTVAQAWQLLSRLPYQSGYLRRAFHAPNHPELHGEKRLNWLTHLIQTYDGYDGDLPWLAAWCPYISYYQGDEYGLLFAAAIEQEDELGKEIYSILVASAQGEHEIGSMGRHITRALLVANYPEGWQFIENLLIAAQRQEGLRQVILETIDEAHPLAFQKFLKLIIEQDLTRFSATVRAADVWFGLGWEAVSQKLVKQALAQVLSFLEERELALQALESYEPEKVYFALWSIAFEDIFTAIPLATDLLQSEFVELRFVAAYLLKQLDTKEAQIALVSVLKDQDLRVATLALMSLINNNDESIQATDLFEILESILPSFSSKPKELKYLVWEWMTLKSSQSCVTTALLNNLGKRSPKRLIPYLPILEVYERVQVARYLAEIKPWDEEVRETLLGLVGDASQAVRTEVITVISKSQVTEKQIIALEKLLTRKSADLRRGILQLILNQQPTNILNCAQRLLISKQALQRQAGLELIREMKAHNICLEACVSAAQHYQEQRKTLTETETQLLDFILEVEQEEATLKNALGLINLEDLTTYTEPKVKSNCQFVTKATRNCLESLDELIETYKHTPISIARFGVIEEELLANLSWLPSPLAEKSREENLEMLPLAETWQNWYAERGENLQDTDGLELARASASYYVNLSRYSGLGSVSVLEDSRTPDWLVKACKTLFVDTSGLRYPQLIPSILEWLIYLFPPANIIDFTLDGAITTLSFIPKKVFQNKSELSTMGWEITASLFGWVQLLVNYRHLSLSEWSDEQHYRYWQLLKTLEIYPLSAYFSYKTGLEDLVILYRAGKATQADIMAHLLVAQPQESSPLEEQRRDFRDLGWLTSRKLPPNLDPILKELGDRARQRILEVELKRGDLPTAATNPALALRSVEGIAILSKLLQSLGKEKLIRGYTYNNTSKAAVFSHLLRVSFPAITETPQDFAAEVKAAKIPEQQLIELAFYAPQWTNYVQYALGWDNFTEGVWWIHAHTKDTNWYVDAEVREEWKVQVSEQTPLSDQNLIDGAVDVEWFLRIYNDLQGERWQKLYAAAKYASSGAGHKRAQLFAEAMLGEISRDTLVKRIQEKRNQDAVRALGLLPIPGERDVLERYQILQEFLRTSRQFGSQRQASEKLAVTIGMENLARSAHYRDPQRLEWAMEAEAIADLTEKPQEVILEDITVSLSITQGKPEISISKQGKPLKAIPAKYKKELAIVELQNRKLAISRQEKRMRISLEQAMLRGDSFTHEEFQHLCRHPILAPMLENLIFIGQEELGYPCHQGSAFRQHDGTIIPLKSASLTIAHPYDLLQTQAWHLWQADCFEAQRRQPFKQIFRELYLLTSSEVTQNNYSRRYEGHQINPKQALALWGQRGWVTCPEEGVRKTFHEANLSVWVSFLQGFYTPLERSGLTLEGIYFTKRGDWKAINLSEVPPKIFSEVMRDVDLIVSVAHLGGIDPEASASTVEMRSALVKESCRLLKLENVSLQGNHALITGQLGSYSLHLGSGMIHRQPGGALCIIPVHSQHRGRIFLPFADDDPKTAEVISKVVLLAKDKEIKDPTILQQIL